MRMSLAVMALALLFGACGGAEPVDDDATVRIYTSVTQDTVDAVVDGFEAAHPEVTVEPFRAPTGELTARIAAELRDDDLRTDVLWLTDPLSIQQYEQDGLLLEWEPANADVVPEDFRSDSFYGTRVLNLVIIANDSLADPPADWKGLTAVDGEVAIPDPGFAGSAFAALGFFALAPDYGMGFYEELEASGAVQVRSPGDVISGVAEGLYAAGITLDRSATAAIDDGSPITLIWPESGAISLYSPIAVIDRDTTATAREFVDYVLGVEAQTAIASTGWEPIRDDVEWSEGGERQTIDWALAFDRQEELLAGYREIFEG